MWAGESVNQLCCWICLGKNSGQEEGGTNHLSILPKHTTSLHGADRCISVVVTGVLREIEIVKVWKNAGRGKALLAGKLQLFQETSQRKEAEGRANGEFVQTEKRRNYMESNSMQFRSIYRPCSARLFPERLCPRS